MLNLNLFRLPSLNRLMSSNSKWLSILGALGTLLCALGICTVWYYDLQILGATNKLVDGIGTSLSGAEQRLGQVQEVAQRAKLTVDDVEQKVKQVATSTAAEKVSTRLQLDSKIEKLDGGLGELKLLLENSTETLVGIGQSLELAASLGLPINPELLRPLLEGLESLLSEVQVAEEAVAGLRERREEDDSEASQDEWRQQALQLTARVLVTITGFEERLQNLQSRLQGTQLGLTTLRGAARRRLLGWAIVLTLLLVWMALGQIALWRSAA